MALSNSDGEAPEVTGPGAQITRFEVVGLFGYLNHGIDFPDIPQNATAPQILIIEGQNGTGKTTIMKMIAGILNGLDFDTFRFVPFSSATLYFSNGQSVSVYSRPEIPDFPLIVTFSEHKVELVRDRELDIYKPAQRAAIDSFRVDCLPLIRAVDFDLLTIDRSLQADAGSKEVIFDPSVGALRRKSQTKSLAHRVRDFLRDAQVNYRRYFQLEDLELLPRILRQFNDQREYNTATLRQRVARIQERNVEIKRFGLQVDEQELETLASLLDVNAKSSEPHAIALLATYVEVHESRSQTRDLLALRLSLFESIMDDFFVGKKIRISVKNGFEIRSELGRITEKDLSSGEYHFLYMMVAALLCERVGTIIAIDEPELSLHVSWQRRLIGALTKCASGASPLFFLSTHSTAISAAHKYAVQSLSAID